MCPSIYQQLRQCVRQLITGQPYGKGMLSGLDGSTMACCGLPVCMPRSRHQLLVACHRNAPANQVSAHRSVQCRPHLRENSTALRTMSRHFRTSESSISREKIRGFQDIKDREPTEGLAGSWSAVPVSNEAPGRTFEQRTGSIDQSK